jgi:hypothetical protein
VLKTRQWRVLSETYEVQVKRGLKMDLEELLRKVETAPSGTAELDSCFASVFPSASRKVTRSIDAAVRLIEIELPGWWWTCGYCTLSNDASLYVPGSKRFPYSAAVMGPDFRSGPEALRLLEDPKWGRRFDEGFHRDRRGGTVPLAILATFLAAKITLSRFQSASGAPEDLKDFRYDGRLR